MGPLVKSPCWQWDFGPRRRKRLSHTPPMSSTPSWDWKAWEMYGWGFPCQIFIRFISSLQAVFYLLAGGQLEPPDRPQVAPHHCHVVLRHSLFFLILFLLWASVLSLIFTSSSLHTCLGALMRSPTIFLSDAVNISTQGSQRRAQLADSKCLYLSVSLAPADHLLIVPVKMNWWRITGLQGHGCICQWESLCWWETGEKLCVSCALARVCLLFLQPNS